MQKPLTLEEIEELYYADDDVIGTALILETRDSVLMTGLIDYMNIADEGVQCICIWNGEATDNCNERDYNRTWRCWQTKPTQEEMDAASWDPDCDDGYDDPEAETILIKYHADLPHLENIGQVSDWIDLRAAESCDMKAGEHKIISLGVSMKLPEGYEAHLAPRSSTFKNWGILMTNSVGVIDNSYSGDNDIWGFSALAMRDTHIEFGDRIAQFRLVKKMEPVQFIQVEHLDDTDRGGFGSTGTN